MSFLPPLPVKRGLALGFTVLTLSLGCSSFSAQSGTPGVGGAGALPSGAAGTSPGGTSGGLGSDSSDAGSAGESSGGDDSGAANAGTSNGGASGSLGLGGHGGKPVCDLVECFVANTCLDQCGGKVVYVGCCACDPPSVSQISCAGGR